MSVPNRLRLRSPRERLGTLADTALPPPDTAAEEHLLVRALRERDEEAFSSLLDRYYSAMLRVASTYVRSRDEAEEVVQDTWLAVLGGIDRFEERSSLRTWIFRILVNRARTRAKREARFTPLSSLEGSASGGGPGALDAIRVHRPDLSASFAWSGAASAPPRPDAGLLAGELHERVEAAIGSLPARQQQVITLRDVEGWTAEEVCDLLEISVANQRVLLHRARTKVRDVLAGYLGADGPEDPTPAPTAV